MSADIRQMKTAAELGLAEIFDAAKQELPGGDPVAARRAAAFQAFEQKGLPHRRVEEWKYTDLRALMRDAKPLALPPDAQDLVRAKGAGALVAGVGARRLTFVNGAFAPELSDLAALEPGLAIAPLAQGLAAGDRLVTVEQVSQPRRGQRFAFIMDTRLCDAAFALADQADILVCECTFAETEAALARDHGHLTAAQAGRIAAESRARLRVLTPFSQRYDLDSSKRLAGEAATAFGGEIVLAHDLTRIPVPPRLGPAAR